MANGLIIVESPAKIKTIKQIVGRRFDICATVGHIKDIPTSQLSVDVENDFAVKYTTIKGKSQAINAIKKAARNVDVIYLATDNDREGEAISWHVMQEIPSTKTVERITFNAITKDDIERALREPHEINQNVVNAQFARRILDRLIGYLLSPEAQRYHGEQLSVGRVQSPAVALVVERERERKAFVPEPYWIIKVTYEKDGATFFAQPREGRIKQEADAVACVEAVRAASAHTVTEVSKKESAKSPPPPFITSSFQRAAFKSFRMGSKTAMRIAQTLYEGCDFGGKSIALITYMRTDSVRISPEGMEKAKEQIETLYGRDYYQRRAYRQKSAAQDAHEAIRPVHPEITPAMAKKHLDANHFKVYELIYRRWLASQMKPAMYERVTADIAAGDVALRAQGERLIFEGYLKAYGKELDENEDATENGDKFLPPLAPHDALVLKDIENEKKMTQPPPRYNNGSLVEKLEKLGIGRPSTYAAIISTIQNRGYVEETGKARDFMPTDKGEMLYDYLKKNRPFVVDYAFTAKLETQLDEVEEGSKNYLDVVKQEFEPIRDAYENYKAGGGYAMSRTPTAKQIGLAQRMAQKLGVELEQDHLDDSKKLSAWIDEMKEKIDMKALPPTPRQIQYAEALARDTGMELTQEMREDARLMSTFIDQAKKEMDLKIAHSKRLFHVKYMDEGVEHEHDSIEIVDILDFPDKKAIGLRLTASKTKWIPRSQIERYTDDALILKSKWAAENVYNESRNRRGSAKRGAKSGSATATQSGSKKAVKKRAKKGAKKAAKK